MRRAVCALDVACVRKPDVVTLRDELREELQRAVDHGHQKDAAQHEQNHRTALQHRQRVLEFRKGAGQASVEAPALLRRRICGVGLRGERFWDEQHPNGGQKRQGDGDTQQRPRSDLGHQDRGDGRRTEVTQHACHVNLHEADSPENQLAPCHKTKQTLLRKATD